MTPTNARLGVRAVLRMTAPRSLQSLTESAGNGGFDGNSLSPWYNSQFGTDPTDPSTSTGPELSVVNGAAQANFPLSQGTDDSFGFPPSFQVRVVQTFRIPQGYFYFMLADVAVTSQGDTSCGVSFSAENAGLPSLFLNPGESYIGTVNGSGNMAYAASTYLSVSASCQGHANATVRIDNVRLDIWPSNDGGAATSSKMSFTTAPQSTDFSASTGVASSLSSASSFPAQSSVVASTEATISTGSATTTSSSDASGSSTGSQGPFSTIPVNTQAASTSLDTASSPIHFVDSELRLDDSKPVPFDTKPVHFRTDPNVCKQPVRVSIRSDFVGRHSIGIVYNERIFNISCYYGTSQQRSSANSELLVGFVVIISVYSFGHTGGFILDLVGAVVNNHEHCGRVGFNPVNKRGGILHIFCGGSANTRLPSGRRIDIYRPRRFNLLDPCQGVSWKPGMNECSLKGSMTPTTNTLVQVYSAVRISGPLINGLRNDVNVILNGVFDASLDPWVSTVTGLVGALTGLVNSLLFTLVNGIASVGIPLSLGLGQPVLYLTETLSVAANQAWYLQADVYLINAQVSTTTSCTIYFRTDQEILWSYYYDRCSQQGRINGSGIVTKAAASFYTQTACTGSTDVSIGFDNIIWRLYPLAAGLNPIVLTAVQVLTNNDFGAGVLAPWVVQNVVSATTDVTVNTAKALQVAFNRIATTASPCSITQTLNRIRAGQTYWLRASVAVTIASSPGLLGAGAKSATCDLILGANFWSTTTTAASSLWNVNVTGIATSDYTNFTMFVNCYGNAVATVTFDNIFLTRDVTLY
ncbi:hypothetical protein PRZ48_008008 [Zasmidium cellare]|uniref:Uncharacterized protein n=1 Tax=Zasmidium cellare TaxID=395010 RepID=A0ABR0EEE2_ZASCE|nr:hypothetical protein PRZ48_008008 [Zasmidium cellare]